MTYNVLSIVAACKQVNELKVKAEEVAETLEQSEVDEPTGEKLKDRFEARLANIERAVHPEEETISKCNVMSDADTDVDAESETASQVGRHLILELENFRANLELQFY